MSAVKIHITPIPPKHNEASYSAVSPGEPCCLQLGLFTKYPLVIGPETKYFTAVFDVAL